MSINIKDILELVRIAGAKVVDSYEKKAKTYQKPDKSLVTNADLESENIVTEGLRKFGYSVLSEEKRDDLSRLRKERIWILDPLDGTVDFLKKTGEFCIMLALTHKKKPILSVVYKPVGDKLYYAEKGKGAYLAEDEKQLKKLQVSKVTSFSKARFLFSRHHLGEREKKFIEDTQIGKVEYSGSFGVKLGLIAEGLADGHFNPSDKTSQWDICAPDLILREAGGEVTDTNGKRFVYNRRGTRNLNGVVASNGLIHDKIIQGVKQIV